MKISSYKQMLSIVFCLLFMLLSATAVILLLITKDFTVKIIGGFSLGLSLLCFVLMIIYARQSAKLKKIYYWVPLKGVQHIGKVYGYELDGKYKKLGKPMVIMDVIYFDFNGNLRLIKIPTDRTNAALYPKQGSNLAFKLYQGFAIIEGGVIEPKSEREFEEMLRGVDIYKTHPQTGFHCPNCGAIVNMPSNMTARCPFCDSWLRVKKR